MMPDVFGITVSIPAAHESDIISSKIQEKPDLANTIQPNKTHLKTENRSEDLPVTFW